MNTRVRLRIFWGVIITGIIFAITGLLIILKLAAMLAN